MVICLVRWFCLKCESRWTTPTTAYKNCPYCCCDNVIITEFVTPKGGQNE